MKYSLTDHMDLCINDINKAHENIETALTLAKEVKSTLSESSWSGQNKVAILSLIELCEKLHEKILEADSKTMKAFKELPEDNFDFHSSSTIMKDWRS